MPKLLNTFNRSTNLVTMLYRLAKLRWPNMPKPLQRRTLAMNGGAAQLLKITEKFSVKHMEAVR